MLNCARPSRRGSIFGPGIRSPLDREARVVWRARLELHRRAGRVTALHAEIARALLRRLGADGRLDPSLATIAADAGASVRTVQRALDALARCGLLSWCRRLVRAGWRAAQTSNAYALTLGDAPAPRPAACDGQAGRGTNRKEKQRTAPPPASRPPNVPDHVRDAARASLAQIAAERNAALQSRWHQGSLGQRRAFQP